MMRKPVVALVYDFSRSYTVPLLKDKKNSLSKSLSMDDLRGIYYLYCFSNIVFRVYCFSNGLSLSHDELNAIINYICVG